MTSASDPATRIAPHCDEPLPRHKRDVLLVVVLCAGGSLVACGFVAAAIALYAVARADTTPAVKADLGPLLREWESNPVAVIERYKGRAVEVRGRVKDVGQNIHRDTFVILTPAQDETREILVYLRPESLGQLMRGYGTPHLNHTPK